MSGYYTVVIPWSPEPTEWHPTERTGPFSTLTRGAHDTTFAAHEWARKHLKGQPYTVRYVSHGSDMVKVNELNLGDIVQLWDGAYGVCTVYRKLENGDAQVWRPYVHTSDFSYTGGTIPYIGIEDFALRAGDEVRFIKAGDTKR